MVTREVAERHEIEAQIAADPYDDAPYAILADILQLAGDPRGELIAIDLAAARATVSERTGWRKRRSELLQLHPELAPVEVPGIQLGWHLGFVRRVTAYLPYDTALFAHPAFAYATELVLPDEHRVEGDRVAAMVRHLPLLRSLALGDPDGLNYPQPGNSIDLDGFIDLARIERLFCVNQSRIKRAPRLRSLELIGGDRETLRSLSDAELPVLERLAIQMRAPRIAFPPRPPNYDPPPIAAIDDFAALLAQPFPRLVELELTDVSCGDALVQALAKSPLLKPLRTLRLWNAGITITGAQHVSRAAFGHLALLDLTDPGLDAATAELLVRAGDNVRTRSTRIDALVRRS